MATVFLALSAIVSGCYDQAQMEEQAFAMSIGIDKGKNGTVLVTYQIGNPQVGSSDKAQAEGEPASEIVSLPAPDVLTARDLANISVARNITFSHTKVLVISEELASSDHFLNIMKSVIRDRQIRREMVLIISKEKASEFIRGVNPALETRPHKFYDLMQKRWRQTGLVPISTLSNFYTYTQADAELYLAIYATTKTDPKKPRQEDEYIAGEVQMKQPNPVQAIGSAVIKEGKMVGTMTGEETRAAMLLQPNSKVEQMFVTYSDPLHPDFLVSARLLKQDPTKVRINVNSEPMEIKAEVPVVMEIISIPSFENYVTDFSKQKLLKEHIETQLEKKAEGYVRRSQKEFQGEPYHWSLEARRQFWTLQQYKQFDWMEKYSSAHVTISYDVTLQRFGKQLHPLNPAKIKD
nr:Ger(x)C family spore germination protein [Paenibacillus turpanensis]